MIDGPDVLRFTRTDWDISMENPHWCLRYSNFDVSFQSSKCIFLYAHTAESFMKMCETLGFIKVCGESILARTINMSRRIHLVNREDKFVKNKGVLCLDGYLGIYKKDVVFMKKVPKVEEFLPIKEILRGVVRALVELRADDILHLNICPENVLLKSGKGVTSLNATWYALERYMLGD
uniref:Protein kinase domain-containing protein n=1 Tax=Tanacetum cinerariifolium TaxID=118510 RepID=A0A6L2NKA5_TANCI|nr:hypothetical protein [Tanacetum cinerariifolium]